MNLRINIIGGPDQGRSFSLAEGQKLTIGRGDQSDTQINDPSVSRVHFEIYHDGAAILIADRGSSSGTMVNGTKIENIEVDSNLFIGNYMAWQEPPLDNVTISNNQFFLRHLDGAAWLPQITQNNNQIIHIPPSYPTSSDLEDLFTATPQPIHADAMRAAYNKLSLTLQAPGPVWWNLEGHPASDPLATRPLARILPK